MRLSSFKIGSGTRGTVLLHGFLGSAKNLRTLAQRWSESDPSRVFLLADLRGHGESPPLSPTTDLTEMGRDVVETARAEGLSGPLHLVGHSLGGRVSLAAARAHRDDEVDAVTCLDISPSPLSSETSESGGVLRILVDAPDDAEDRRDLRGFLTGRGLSGPIADWLMMNVVQTEDGRYRWRFDRAALFALHTRVNREDLWDAVDCDRLKLHFVRGGRSGYVSDAEMERLQGGGCRVDTIARAGHFVHVETQDELLSLLTGE